MCLSFGGTNTLHLVGCPPVFADHLLHTLGLLVKKREQLTEKHFHACEITFSGWPWAPAGEAAVTTRMVVLKLLGVLERHGYTLYGSIDTEVGNRMAPEAWFCCRETDWEPGKPVYHA